MFYENKKQETTEIVVENRWLEDMGFEKFVKFVALVIFFALALGFSPAEVMGDMDEGAVAQPVIAEGLNDGSGLLKYRGVFGGPDDYSAFDEYKRSRRVKRQ
ncbi:hypothetical protein AAG570_005531 [Ranatra chinensis]|uniref:Uncharacterized protein n=1 Tax=Ranatra chinensis TaxID=642074 RepID=A0ABD0XXP8_9HEMI